MTEDDERGAERPAQLRLSLEGYEGPLDVMLHLAQAKKLDLSKISVLALAAQYLRFIERRRDSDLTGEYLLMAAALIYMKSRLALPPEREERGRAEMSAERLRFRLSRLAALREAADRLFARRRLGAGIFARGAPEEARVIKRTEYQANLTDLLSAYAQAENRRRKRTLKMGREQIFWPLAEARQAVEKLLAARGAASGGGWLNLPEALALLPAKPEGADWSGAPAAERRRRAARAVQASGFAAALELARQGKAALRQAGAFSPLYARAADAAGRA